MDSDSWIRDSTSSTFPSDSFYGGEDIDDSDDDSLPEFMCPFCEDDFHMLGLCCHLHEEHTAELNYGVCPICSKSEEMDLAGHITMKHASLLKVQRKRRYCRDESDENLSILKKELQEGNFQNYLGGYSSSAEPDALLLSFIFNPQMDDDDEPTNATKLHSSNEISTVNQSSIQDTSERKTQQSNPVSDKDQEEKARKCEFVQELLMSTFLDD